MDNGNRAATLPPPEIRIIRPGAACKKSLNPSPSIVLSLSEVLDALVAGGHADRAESDKLIADRRMHRSDHHPLVVIADQKWRVRVHPARS